MTTPLKFAAALFALLYFVESLAAQTEGGTVPQKPFCKCQLAGQATQFSKKEARYQIPDVTLTRMDGKRVSAREELDREGPTVIQFAFTSCATICPVLSSTTAQLQKQLGADAKKVRIVTISIDPRHDTAAVLQEYARSLEAGKDWHFLTGDPGSIARIQKAFDAYTPNKSRHEALTFLRSGRTKPWLRVTGLISATALTKEVRALLGKSDRKSSALETGQNRAGLRISASIENEN